MSVDQNRETVRRFNEKVWGKGRVELIEELFSPDFVNHYAAPAAPPGRKGIRHEVERVRSMFPDVAIKTEDIVCEGDRAALRWSGSGTHTGDVTGLPATGKPATMSGMHFYRFREGQIIELWAEFDGARVMRQLGITPAGLG